MTRAMLHAGAIYTIAMMLVVAGLNLIIRHRLEGWLFIGIGGALMLIQVLLGPRRVR